MLIKNKYRQLLILVFFWISFADIQANSGDQSTVEDSNLLGEARLSVLFWDIYDAKLYAEGLTYDPDAPFALSLRYLMKLKGIDIAEKSIDEIRKQGFEDENQLLAWQRSLELIFPDVSDGDEILGVSNPVEGTTFYLNGSLIGRIDDMNLSRKFFDIWLSEKTSEPELRKSLLGLNNP